MIKLRDNTPLDCDGQKKPTRPKEVEELLINNMQNLLTAQLLEMNEILGNQKEISNEQQKSPKTNKSV